MCYDRPLTLITLCKRRKGRYLCMDLDLKNARTSSIRRIQNAAQRHPAAHQFPLSTFQPVVGGIGHNIVHWIGEEKPRYAAGLSCIVFFSDHELDSSSRRHG